MLHILIFYWLGNTNSDAELVIAKQLILSSPKKRKKKVFTASPQNHRRAVNEELRK